MVHLKHVSLACAVLSACLPSHAQDGSNDPEFNATDVGFWNGDGAGNQLQATTIQPDGKILIGGVLGSYNGLVSHGITRLLTDGTPDLSFNAGTGVGCTAVSSISLQSDERIVIAGGFTSIAGTPRNRIARLNADGSLDTGFDPGTGANNWVTCTALQGDGKTIIGGAFTEINGTPRNRIARLNTDGTLDTSFDPEMGANERIERIAVQGDGKIIIGGSFTSYDGAARNSIARLNMDGSLDTGFGVGSGCNSPVNSLVLRSDGKIIIGGTFTSCDGIARNRLARLNNDGSVDMALDPGSGASSAIMSLALQADGKVIIGGYFETYDGAARRSIARLNDDGSLDTGFDTGTGADNAVFGTAIQDDGKIMIVGGFGSYNGANCGNVTRLNSDGGRDFGFNPGTGADGPVYCSVVQPDDQILIAGNFSRFNGVPHGRIARLNTDGTLDMGFATGVGANGPISCMALRPDGKIIIGGGFTEFNGTPRYCLARLNADGSVDTGFGTGTGPDGWVLSAVIQDDGKIIIAGGFWNYDGTPRNYIARTDPDGSLDTSFDPGTGANNWIRSVSLGSDGKIIIAGDFYGYNGTTRYYVARLNNDGSLDTGFDSGAGPSSQLFSTLIQPDGKVIIGGSFNNVGGVPSCGIARLDVDGSLDTSFDPGTGTGQDNGIMAMTFQPDGKILVCGDFTSYDNVPHNFIARVNTDGSLDSAFDPGTGANMEIMTTALQANGAVIIGGAFTSYDGTGRNRVARLHNGQANIIAEMAATDMTVAPNPGSGIFTLTCDRPGPVVIHVTDPSGREVLQQRAYASPGQSLIIDLLDRSAGIYFVTLLGRDWRTVGQLVKR